MATADLTIKEEKSEHRDLTSGRLLVGNVAWNFIGLALPILIAGVCLPILKKSLGTDRLGVITLAWVVIGYFGFFDFGLSRALTKLVAQRTGENQFDDIPSLVWTSLFMLCGIGIFGAVLVFVITPWLVNGPLKVPAGLRKETLAAFYWLSLSIPVVTVSAGLRGVVEAFQRFRLATAIRIPMGIFTYLGPVLVLPFSKSLPAVIAILVFFRAIFATAYFFACFRTVPHMRHGVLVQANAVGPLVRFGSWMTVSNLIGPFMVTFDRFVIGSLISLSAVAYYAVPYEVVTKLWMIPGAILGVLFPAFSAAHARDQRRLAFLYECGTKYVYLLLFPVAATIIAFAPEGLRHWLGHDFAANSSAVTRCLTIGVFLNSVANVPFAHLQSAGRPDITAKLHLIELPVYAVLLFTLIGRMGIPGAALAWTTRVTIDMVFLFLFSRRLLAEKRFIYSRLPFMLATATAAFGVLCIPMALILKSVFLGALLILWLIITWVFMLSHAERHWIHQKFRVRNPLAEQGAD